MKKYFARLSQGSMCSTYPTYLIAVYSLGYALGAGSHSSPAHHGGDTTTNVPSCKTRTTSSAASTSLSAITFTSSAKRNDTNIIISGGVRLSSVAARNFKPSTLRFSGNSKESWRNRKRNCRAIMRQRAERRSTLGWIKLLMKEQSLKENSELCLNKKSSPLNDKALGGEENFLRGMTLRSKTRVTS